MEMKLNRATVTVVTATVITVPAMLAFLLLIKEMTLVFALRLTGIYCFLIPVAFIDYRYKIIPNRLHPICIGIALSFSTYMVVSGGASFGETMIDMFTGLVLGGGVFLSAAVLTRGGVGMGDVKLFGVLGLALGFRLTFCLILYTLISVALFGTLLLVLGRASLKTKVALGPFVLLGAVMIALLG